MKEERPDPIMFTTLKYKEEIKMGPMNLPWGTWFIYPFMVLETVIVLVWAYMLKKKFAQEGDDAE